MEQILASENGKEDVLELIDGDIYLTVETQNYMTPWFKRCLLKAFPKLRFGETIRIDAGIMAKVVDVYIYTR